MIVDPVTMHEQYKMLRITLMQSITRRQGDALFWSVTLLLMIADDAAMIAMMFS
jgi:hypothetical protein